MYVFAGSLKILSAMKSMIGNSGATMFVNGDKDCLYELDECDEVCVDAERCAKGWA